MDKFFSLIFQFPITFHITSFTPHSKEDGPDFDLETLHGVAYAELTEIAHLNRSSYSSAQRISTVGEYVEKVIKLIQKKETIYSTSKQNYKPLYLVIYISDDAFSPTQRITEI